MKKFTLDATTAIGIAATACTLGATILKHIIDGKEKEQMENKIVEKVMERISSKQD